MGEGGGQSNAEDGLSLVFHQYAFPHPFKQWLPRHHTSQTVSSTSDQQNQALHQIFILLQTLKTTHLTQSLTVLS